MCFTSIDKRTKIAEKPIRVYKHLLDNNESRFQCFEYHKGINEPLSKTTPSMYNPFNDLFLYTSSWLHAYKYKQYKAIGKVVVMYIPKGTEYKDNDIIENSYIISRELYWPKNIFERIYYWLVSKHY